MDMEAALYIIWIAFLIIAIVYRIEKRAKFKREYLTPTASQIQTWKELEQQKKAQAQALKLQNEKLEEEKRKRKEEAERLRMIEEYSKREGEKSRRFGSIDDTDDLPF